MTLVIDDDRDICVAIAQTLKDGGYEVACASNGAEALRLLRHEPAPALILLDLFMPEVTGRGVLEELRQEPRLKGVPVILTTGADSGEVSAVRGAREVLHKPFPVETLLSAVARYVGPPCDEND